MTQQPLAYSQQQTCSKTLRYDQYYIDLAHLTAALSYDKDIRVGSVIVKDGQLISQGWNGTPAGMDNDMRDADGWTYPWVIHSEANALMKLAKNGGGADGSVIYCTHSPCYDCALLLLQAGVRRIVYSRVYCEDSLLFMKERGLELVSIEPSNRIPTVQDLKG